VTRTPVRIPGIDDALEVSMDVVHLCARRRDGQVSCWNRDDGPRGLPPVTELAPPCALAEDGRVWCWGNNGYGEMGLGFRSRPGLARDPALIRRSAAVPGLVGITGLSSSMVGTTCAVTDGGGVLCWGTWGPRSPTVRPTRIALPPAREVWMGTRGGCALSREGRVHCWEDEWQIRERTDVGLAAHLPSHGRGPARAEPLCVVTPERRLRCAGTPAPLPELREVRQVSLSTHHNSLIPTGCAVLEAGELRCWGPPYCAGGVELCVPTAWNQIDTVLTGVRQVSMGDDRACAARVDGTVWCWGSTANGWFGGPRRTVDRPVLVDLASLAR
jgi:hypothetical protein